MVNFNCHPMATPTVTTAVFRRINENIVLSKWLTEKRDSTVLFIQTEVQCHQITKSKNNKRRQHRQPTELRHQFPNNGFHGNILGKLSTTNHPLSNSSMAHRHFQQHLCNQPQEISSLPPAIPSTHLSLRHEQQVPQQQLQHLRFNSKMALIAHTTTATRSSITHKLLKSTFNNFTDNYLRWVIQRDCHNVPQPLTPYQLGW